MPLARDRAATLHGRVPAAAPTLADVPAASRGGAVAAVPGSVPGGLAVALTLASGALFAFAFPPWRLRALAWVALVPLFLALRTRSLALAMVLAELWTVEMAWLLGDWMPRAVSVYFEQPSWVGGAFFLGCATITAGVYYVAFAPLYRRLACAPGVATPLLVAAAWTTVELARGRLLTGTTFFIGNPWALIGYSQVGGGPVVQVAALGGVYAIGFVLVAVNAAIAETVAALAAGGERASAGRLAGILALAATPAVAAWIYGSAALRGAAAEPRPDLPVAVVQARIDVGHLWQRAWQGANLAAYLHLTDEAIRDAAPRLVIWPENAMTFHVDRDAAARTAIADVLGPHDVELIAGGPRAEGPPDAPRYLNSVFLLGPDGALRDRYDKQYLVPFSEFFPFAGIDLLRRRFERERVFARGGPDARLLPTVLGPAGIVTCNEGMLPEVVAARVAAGASWLVNPSNDSWLADAKYSALQMDIVTLRAVEQRRWLVRASTSGPSALVDPWGRVTGATPPLAQAWLGGVIAARGDRTPYQRLGDAFALTCALAVAVAVAAPRARARHARRTGRTRRAMR